MNGAVQLGQLGNAMAEISQMLSQAMVLPFRQPRRRDHRRPPELVTEPSRALAPRARGTLLVGAGTLPDEQVIDLIHQAGGRRARAVVLPVAAYSFAVAGERYRRALQRFGMERLETLGLSTRPQAENPSLAAAIAGADLILMGGGDAALLLGILSGTPAEAALVSALIRGAAVCAVGAAAEALGERVLAGPVGTAVECGRGLGLLPGTMVVAAGRNSAHLAAVFGSALTSSVQVLVLDDRCTVLIRPGWQAEVRSGTMLAVAPSRAGSGQTAGRRPVGEVAVRVAPAGWKLDLPAGMVLPPGASADGRAPR